MVGIEVRSDTSNAGHNIAHAHLAATYLLPKITSFECFRQRLAKLMTAVDSRQPEADSCRIVVARAKTMTFDEW